MPNYVVFSNKPEDVKVQIYGSDTDNPISVDTNGKLYLKSIEDTVNINGTVTATDLDIRNLSSTQDNILIHGNDGTNNVPIAVDPTGKIVISSTGTLNVQATDLDIRNLNNSQDNILIYGLSSGGNTAVSTSTTGAININHDSRTYYESSWLNITTQDTYQYTDFIDVSNFSTYSFYVKNTGLVNLFDVLLQISPTTNADDAVDILTLASISPGSKDVIVAPKFLRYIRLGYKNTALSLSTTINIYFQARV